MAPVINSKREFLPDSGGAGSYRDGLGQHIEISAAKPQDLMLFLSVERTQNPAKGRHGGLDGAAGRIRIEGTANDLPSKGKIRIKAGETLIIQTPGGGGFGPPQNRDTSALRRVLTEDLLSP